jgi:hypothetical protein
MTKRINYKYSKKFQYCCPIDCNEKQLAIPMVQPKHQFDGCLEQWIDGSIKDFIETEGFPPKYIVVAKVEIGNGQFSLGICCLDGKPSKSSRYPPVSFDSRVFYEWI